MRSKLNKDYEELEIGGQSAATSQRSKTSPEDGGRSKTTHGDDGARSKTTHEGGPQEKK